MSSIVSAAEMPTGHEDRLQDTVFEFLASAQPSTQLQCQAALKLAPFAAALAYVHLQLHMELWSRV